MTDDEKAEIEALGFKVGPPKEPFGMADDVIRTVMRHVLRDANGRIIKRPIGPTCKAILAELDRKQMTRYRLWQIAKGYCPNLSLTATYEYLRGESAISVYYVEGLLRAAGLTAEADALRDETGLPSR